MGKDQFLNKLFVEQKNFEKFDAIKFENFIEEVIVCRSKCEDMNVWKSAISEICQFYLNSEGKLGWKYYLERLTFVSFLFYF